MNGTPHHLSLLMCKTAVQNVEQREPSGTVGSSRYPSCLPSRDFVYWPRTTSLNSEWYEGSGVEHRMYIQSRESNKELVQWYVQSQDLNKYHGLPIGLICLRTLTFSSRTSSSLNEAGRSIATIVKIYWDIKLLGRIEYWDKCPKEINLSWPATYGSA